MGMRARVHERGKTKNKGRDKNEPHLAFAHGRLKREHEYSSRNKSLQLNGGGGGVVIITLIVIALRGRPSSQVHIEITNVINYCTNHLR